MRLVPLVALCFVLLILASGCVTEKTKMSSEEIRAQAQADRETFDKSFSQLEKAQPSDLTDNEDSFGGAELSARDSVPTTLERQDDLGVADFSPAAILDYLLSLLGIHSQIPGPGFC